ncbi:hypothetical protein J6590_041792 [Homalodisca vitripennis]|nr:hypothetical protein J6590_041792 [Homalodisca vitripennis]
MSSISRLAWPQSLRVACRPISTKGEKQGENAAYKLPSQHLFENNLPQPSFTLKELVNMDIVEGSLQFDLTKDSPHPGSRPDCLSESLSLSDSDTDRLT